MKFKTLNALAAFLILLILAFLTWSLSAPDPYPRAGGFKTEQERTEIRLKMDHHGIFTAILDRETGKAYFMRDGVKCRL